jgi:hypothetical protein
MMVDQLERICLEADVGSFDNRAPFLHLGRYEAVELFRSAAGNFKAEILKHFLGTRGIQEIVGRGIELR